VSTSERVALLAAIRAARYPERPALLPPGPQSSIGQSNTILPRSCETGHRTLAAWITTKREPRSVVLCKYVRWGWRCVGSVFLGAPYFGTKRLNCMKGKLPRNANIDLGLAILASTSEPPHTAQTIAAYCGCSRQCIQQIEQKALRKLRAALCRNRILSEAFENELQGLSK
jgi:hypothetical protein